MDITYLSNGSIRISGKSASLVCDPVQGGKKSNADITLLTSTLLDSDAAGGMLIDGPGEYEVKETLITGVPVRLHVDEVGFMGVAYHINMDGITAVFLGNIDANLNNDQIEPLSGVDVLFVPVGGHGLTLDAEAASKIVTALEPKYVIPTHYNDGVSQYEMSQDGVDKFLAEMGVKVDPQTKLKVNTRDLPVETTVVVLEPQR